MILKNIFVAFDEFSMVLRLLNFSPVFEIYAAEYALFSLCIGKLYKVFSNEMFHLDSNFCRSFMGQSGQVVNFGWLVVFRVFTYNF